MKSLYTFLLGKDSHTCLLRKALMTEIGLSCRVEMVKVWGLLPGLTQIVLSFPHYFSTLREHFDNGICILAS